MRVLIVDDERLARIGLRQHLAGQPGIEIVGECADGESAALAIVEHAPDIVFLDVQMPGLDGFEVVERVGPERMPAVVFVTAYDEHALRAFDAGAIDYLLKPFDRERFQDALARATRRVSLEHAEDLAAKLETLLGRVGRAKVAVDETSPAAERIPASDGGRIVFIPPSRIDWVEAAGNYVHLHVGDRSYTIRQTLEESGRRLGPRFIRVRRSALVNRDAVEAAELLAKGSFVLFLRGGRKLRTSRHYRASLEPMLEGL